MARSTKPYEAKPEDHWGNYVDYNRTLRTWFVSFGIGGPIVLLANPSLLQALKSTDRAHWVAGLFLVGCGLQVLVALINKTAAYYLYCGERDEEFQSDWRYRRCEQVSEWFWLDLGFDVLTFAAFAAAVVLLVDINVYDIGPVDSPPMPN